MMQILALFEVSNYWGLNIFEAVGEYLTQNDDKVVLSFNRLVIGCCNGPFRVITIPHPDVDSFLNKQKKIVTKELRGSFSCIEHLGVFFL